MAKVTITFEEMSDGKVRIESDPDLTELAFAIEEGTTIATSPPHFALMCWALLLMEAEEEPDSTLINRPTLLN